MEFITYLYRRDILSIQKHKLRHIHRSRGYTDCYHHSVHCISLYTLLRISQRRILSKQIIFHYSFQLGLIKLNLGWSTLFIAYDVCDHILKYLAQTAPILSWRSFTNALNYCKLLWHYDISEKSWLHDHLILQYLIPSLVLTYSAELSRPSRLTCMAGSVLYVADFVFAVHRTLHVTLIPIHAILKATFVKNLNW